MYVEFKLPFKEGMLKYTKELLSIRKELVNWSIKYGIQYKEKIIKNVVKVTFSNPEHYTFFGLTWDHSAAQCRLVEPMKPPK